MLIVLEVNVESIYTMCLYHMHWYTDIHIFPYHLLLSSFILLSPPTPSPALRYEVF